MIESQIVTEALITKLNEMETIVKSKTNRRVAKERNELVNSFKEQKEKYKQYEGFVKQLKSINVLDANLDGLDLIFGNHPQESLITNQLVSILTNDLVNEREITQRNLAFLMVR